MAYKNKSDYQTYRKTKYGHVSLDMPIEEFKRLKEYCSDNGLKVNTFLRALITEKINSN